jgi:putative ABC transport system permease protein
VFAKKLRLLSTALAVILGIAFLVGTLVFTATMNRTFDDLFADIYADTDTVVRSASSVDTNTGWAVRGRIPADTVTTVRAVPGVAAAEPSVEGFTQVVGADGKAIGKPGQGPPTFGGNYLPKPLGPWVLTEGSRPPGPGELVIDVRTARQGKLHVGDQVTVLTQTGPHQLPLVGTARFGSADSPGGASVSLFDLATAQQVLLGGTNEIDTVSVAAVGGVSEQELTARIAAVLPGGMEALTGRQITAEQQNQMADAMGFVGTFFTVFAVIGLVVACFTIFNTFQIVVTQRSREMAMLRAVGASRGQVLGAQLVEAVVVGIGASVVGMFVGVGVAGALKAMLAGFGVDVPAGGTVFLPRTAIIALVVGTLVTVVSAVFPALRASRIPPIAALRDVALDRSGQTWHRLALGGGLLALGIAGFVAGLAGAGLVWVGVGALAAFVGVFVLGPLMARPVSAAIGAPLPALTGITGEIARENSMRNPKRTARTGGALMVGVALVVAINVLAASAKDWIRDVFNEQFTGDYVVSTDVFGIGGLSPQLAADLNKLPEVKAATGIRIGFAHLTGEHDANVQYTAVDPRTVGQIFDIDMRQGAIEALDDRGVLVNTAEAEKRHVVVGDTMSFGFASGQTRDLVVEGTYGKDDLAGKFVVTHSLHESVGADQFDFSVYIVTQPGVSDQAARTAIGALADKYANADLQSRSQYLDDQAAQLDPLVNLMYGMLALAIVIALFSIANSMALSIHERTRELGLLRAVGMTRGQLRSAVRWETVLVSLLGTGLGVLLGIFFGWAISVTMRDGGLTNFVLPVTSVVVVAALAVIGGVLATVRPAWRASRLSVISAISTE